MKVFWFSFFLGFLGLLCINLPISVASGSVAEFHFHQVMIPYPGSSPLMLLIVIFDVCEVSSHLGCGMG